MKRTPLQAFSEINYGKISFRIDFRFNTECILLNDHLFSENCIKQRIGPGICSHRHPAWPHKKLNRKIILKLSQCIPVI